MSHHIPNERRRAPRWREPGVHGVRAARVRPGRDVVVLNVSAGGALIETDRRLLPGTVVGLRLEGPQARVAIRGNVLRCSVCRLEASTIWYRGAISFEHPLSWLVSAEQVPSMGVGDRQRDSTVSGIAYSSETRASG